MSEVHKARYAFFVMMDDVDLVFLYKNNAQNQPIFVAVVAVQICLCIFLTRASSLSFLY
jgi:hypothetical protein